MNNANSWSIGVEKEQEIDWSSLYAAKNSLGDWREPEGEGKLNVDVAETKDELIVTAPMAGTLPQNMELHLHNDLLTIRGERTSPVPPGSEYSHSECYWGKFSRTVVLPVDVKAELAQAEYKNGVLTIRLPKAVISSNIPIMVVEE